MFKGSAIYDELASSDIASWKQKYQDIFSPSRDRSRGPTQPDQLNSQSKHAGDFQSQPLSVGNHSNILENKSSGVIASGNISYASRLILDNF